MYIRTGDKAEVILNIIKLVPATVISKTPDMSSQIVIDDGRLTVTPLVVMT